MTSLWYEQILQLLWTDGLTEIRNCNDLHRTVEVNQHERMLECLTLTLVFQRMHCLFPLTVSFLKWRVQGSIHFQYGADNDANGPGKLYECQLVHTFPECSGVTSLSSSLSILLNKWRSKTLTQLLQHVPLFSFLHYFSLNVPEYNFISL